jgi:hypothetical protein
MAVYFDKTTNTFKAALATVSGSDYISAAPSALWQGLIESVAGTVADIVVGGTLTLVMADWDAVWDGGVAVAGDVFLSEITAGNLSSTPGNLGLYIGHLKASGEMLIRLGGTNNYTQHIHLKRTILAKPAGTVVDPVFNADQVITTPDITEQGWLPATPTYFPGYVVGVEIPATAAYGYNILHADEDELQAVFPFVPPNNAILIQSGVLVDAAKYSINQYGIWWLADSYGDAPWPVDYTAVGVVNDLDLYTSKILANSEILDLVVNEVLSQIVDSINNLSVFRLKTTDPYALGMSATAGDNVNGYYGTVTVSNEGVTGVDKTKASCLTVTGTNDLGDVARGVLTLKTHIGYELPHLFTYVDTGLETSELWDPLGSTVNGLFGHRVSLWGWVDFALRLDAGFLATETLTASLSVTCAINSPPAVGLAVTSVHVYALTANTPLAYWTYNCYLEADLNKYDSIQIVPILISGPGSLVFSKGQTMVVRILGYELTPPAWIRIPMDTLRIVSVNADIVQS